jgi:hypothetical protein
MYTWFVIASVGFCSSNANVIRPEDQFNNSGLTLRPAPYDLPVPPWTCAMYANKIRGVGREHGRLTDAIIRAKQDENNISVQFLETKLNKFKVNQIEELRHEREHLKAVMAEARVAQNVYKFLRAETQLKCVNTVQRGTFLAMPPLKREPVTVAPIPTVAPVPWNCANYAAHIQDIAGEQVHLKVVIAEAKSAGNVKDFLRAETKRNCLDQFSLDLIQPNFDTHTAPIPTVAPIPWNCANYAAHIQDIAGEQVHLQAIIAEAKSAGNVKDFLRAETKWKCLDQFSLDLIQPNFDTPTTDNMGVALFETLLGILNAFQVGVIA